MFSKLKKIAVFGITMTMILGVDITNISSAKNIGLSNLILVSQASNTNTNTNTDTNTDYSKVPEIEIDSNGNITNGLNKVEDKGKALNRVLTEYRGIVTFISAIAMISMIMFFILNLIALGNSKGNPQERQKAITGLIVSGIATAGLGAVTLIVGLFFNMIK